MKKPHLIGNIYACLLLFSLIAPAESALIKFEYTGSCTSSSTCSPVGLSDGDPVSGSLTIDDSFLPAIGEFFNVSNSNLSSLDFAFGNQTFTTDDIDTTGHITFTNFSGIVVLYNGSLTLAGNGPFDLSLSSTDGGVFAISTSGGNEGIAFGAWANAGAVVPIPATAWLFGSGLLGLVGLARRKAA